MTGNDLNRAPIFDGWGCGTLIVGLAVAAVVWCGAWYLAALMVHWVFLD